MDYKTSSIRYCASVSFNGQIFQINYRTPRELVKALRDMGTSATANFVIRRVYTKGK